MVVAEAVAGGRCGCHLALPCHPSKISLLNFSLTLVLLDTPVGSCGDDVSPLVGALHLDSGAEL